MSLEDEYEGWEPEPEELEAMIEAEREFRREHDLEDPRDWEEYCDERGREWLASRGEDTDDARARAFIVEEVTRRVEQSQRVDDPGAIAASVPVEERWPYELTPIEAQFYDVLAETGLTFSVQPWMQHADRKYRADFIIWYDGRAVVVELDGHDYHKTKEQRGHDAQKDRWLQSRGIRVVRFTGSEVYADADRCVRELLDVIRQSQARP